MNKIVSTVVLSVVSIYNNVILTWVIRQSVVRVRHQKDPSHHMTPSVQGSDFILMSSVKVGTGIYFENFFPRSSFRAIFAASLSRRA